MINQKVVGEAFVKKLEEDGVDPQLIDLFKVQGYMCFLAYEAALMAALRLEIEGEITAEEVKETAMDFAKLIIMKVTVGSGPSSVVKPPAGGIITMPPEGGGFLSN